MTVTALEKQAAREAATWKGNKTHHSKTSSPSDSLFRKDRLPLHSSFLSQVNVTQNKPLLQRTVSQVLGCRQIICLPFSAQLSYAHMLSLSRTHTEGSKNSH